MINERMMNSSKNLKILKKKMVEINTNKRIEIEELKDRREETIIEIVSIKIRTIKKIIISQNSTRINRIKMITIKIKMIMIKNK